MDLILIRVHDRSFDRSHDIEMPELNYEELIKQIRDCFKIPGGDGEIPFHISANQCKLSNQEQLKQAYQGALECGDYMLKLDIDFNLDPSQSFIQQDYIPEEYVTQDPHRARSVASVSSDTCSFIVLSTQHFEFPCSLCNEEIWGSRFKCLNCDNDFDICETCEKNIDKHHPAEHVFAKIRHPGDWEQLLPMLMERNMLAAADHRESSLPVKIVSNSAILNCDATGKLDELLKQSYVEWTLLSHKNGKLLKNTVVEQKWQLDMKGGVHWPIESLRVIAIKQLLSDSVDNKPPIIESFLESLECWSALKRDCQTGRIICDTNCSIDVSDLLSDSSIRVQQVPHSLDEFSVSVNWHICTNAWPPRPLAVGMTTHFHVYFDAYGKWIVDFESPSSSADVGNDLDILAHAPVSAIIMENAYRPASVVPSSDNSFASAVQNNEVIPSTEAAATETLCPESNVLPTVDPMSSALAGTEHLQEAPVRNQPGSTMTSLLRMGLTDPFSGTPMEVDSPPYPHHTQAEQTVPDSEEMLQLIQMGFTDRETNKLLLEKHHNNMDLVVNELVE